MLAKEYNSHVSVPWGFIIYVWNLVGWVRTAVKKTDKKFSGHERAIQTVKVDNVLQE